MGIFSKILGGLSVALGGLLILSVATGDLVGFFPGLLFLGVGEQLLKSS